MLCFYLIYPLILVPLVGSYDIYFSLKNRNNIINITKDNEEKRKRRMKMREDFIKSNGELKENVNLKLEDVLKEIGKDDELIITMDKRAADNSALLYDMLWENGFEVLSKGENDGDKYHIIVHRKK